MPEWGEMLWEGLCETLVWHRLDTERWRESRFGLRLGML